MLQILMLKEAENPGEEIWNQFIGTDHSKEFINFQKICKARINKMFEMFVKTQSSYPNFIQGSTSFSNQQPNEGDDEKKSPPIMIATTKIEENNKFFTRELKYVAEEKKIGAGTFGAIYLAHLVSDPQQKFALKKLFNNQNILQYKADINAGNKSLQYSYKQEYDCELETLMKVKRINSPFLIKYIGAQLLKSNVADTHKLELIMELCDGDLLSYIKDLEKKNKKLSISECYEIFCQIVEGMLFLHKNGIMHRDIKPQNILYKKMLIEGKESIVWKICDFGLASMKKVLSDSVGTLIYMAPETRNRQEYEKSVDIWSLGLVFHKLLFGYDYYVENSLKKDYILSGEEKNIIDEKTQKLLFYMIENNHKKRIKIEEIRKILQERDEYKIVRKILDMEENIEKIKNQKSNLEENYIEEAQTMKDVDEIIENGIEWHMLGCYNKSLNMFNEGLMIMKKLKIKKFCSRYSRIYNCIGTELIELNNLKPALKNLNKALCINLILFGSESTEIAGICNNIGIILQSLKRYEEAFQYFTRALKIYITNYDKDSLKVASAYNNIGTLLQTKGNFCDALQYYNFALNIYTNHYDQEDIQIAKIYNNIANTLQSLEKYEKALQNYNSALKISSKHYGDEHVHIAHIYNDIGATLQKLGKSRDALKYLNYALTIFNKYYGYESIELIPVYGNLACTFLSLNKAEEALKYFKLNLKISFLHYDKESIQISVASVHIGNAFRFLGNYKEALDEFNKALNIIIKHYGNDHLQTGIIYHNIGNVLQLLGKLEEALNCFNYALKIFRQHYENDHLQIAIIYKNIGELLDLFNKNEEALQHKYASLNIYIKHFGNENIQIATVYNSIANSLDKLCKLDETLKYKSYALDMYINYYEKKGMQTSTAFDNINYALDYLEKQKESLNHHDQDLEAQIKLYGDDHIQIAKKYYSIGKILQALGKQEEALNYINHALKIILMNYSEKNTHITAAYGTLGISLYPERNPESHQYFASQFEVMQNQNTNFAFSFSQLIWPSIS